MLGSIGHSVISFEESLMLRLKCLRNTNEEGMGTLRIEPGAIGSVCEGARTVGLCCRNQQSFENEPCNSYRENLRLVKGLKGLK